MQRRHRPFPNREFPFTQRPTLNACATVQHGNELFRLHHVPIRPVRLRPRLRGDVVQRRPRHERGVPPVRRPQTVIVFARPRTTNAPHDFLCRLPLRRAEPNCIDDAVRPALRPILPERRQQFAAVRALDVQGLSECRRYYHLRRREDKISPNDLA